MTWLSHLHVTLFPFNPAVLTLQRSSVFSQEMWKAPSILSYKASLSLQVNTHTFSHTHGELLVIKTVFPSWPGLQIASGRLKVCPLLPLLCFSFHTQQEIWKTSFGRGVFPLLFFFFSYFLKFAGLIPSLFKALGKATE